MKTLVQTYCGLVAYRIKADAEAFEDRIGEGMIPSPSFIDLFCVYSSSLRREVPIAAINAATDIPINPIAKDGVDDLSLTMLI